MPRESPDYRANLEQLNRLFPDRELLRAAEVAQVLGCSSVNTVKRKVPMQRGQISKAHLARILCEY